MDCANKDDSRWIEALLNFFEETGVDREPLGCICLVVLFLLDRDLRAHKSFKIYKTIAARIDSFHDVVAAILIWAHCSPLDFMKIVPSLTDKEVARVCENLNRKQKSVFKKILISKV